CLLFAADAGVDRDRSVTMALLHDLAEAETGDVIARAASIDRDVSEELKARLEAAAIERLLPPELGELRHVWQDYEGKADEVALFVRDMNLIDMCMQAAIYQEQRRYDPEATVPSQGGYTHLDEFFVSAGTRLRTAVGKRLFGDLEARYYAARGGTGHVRNPTLAE